MIELDRRRLLLALAGVWVRACTRPRPPRLAAAASTASAIEPLLAGFEVQTSYAASSTLARQIEAGAPFDLFLSADPTWVDRLQERGLVVDGSRRRLFGNRLVVAIASGRPRPGLDAAPPGRVAIADPAHVPLGRYGREALETLGWWSSVEDRLLTTADARAAARLIAIGEADWGLIYASDAVAGSGLEVLWALPESSHRAIVYELVELPGAHPSAQAITAALASSEALAGLLARGWSPPPLEG